MQQVRPSVAYLRLKKTWQRLPDEPMPSAVDPTSDESLKAIQTAGDLAAHDLATASAWRIDFVAAGALIQREGANGRPEYVKATFPDPDTPQAFMERERRELARAQAQERAVLDHADMAVKNALANIAAPAKARDRLAFGQLLDSLLRERGLDADSLGLKIEAAVEAALARHFAVRS